MAGHILVIDQGTTSTRAVVFDERAIAVGSAQMEFREIYPHPGWIEHDPEDLWRTMLSTAREALSRADGTATVAALGITNQRETTLVGDRKSGAPIYNAIVWQDRRTADRCAELSRDGHAGFVRERTGLVLDPCFSAKIAWIFDDVPGARERAARGEFAFGTVDAFLLWRLTGGAVHATDATNAARTSLLDIRMGRWDDDRVDGGMAASDWTMQFLADIVGAPVDRPTYRETTSLGAALLAAWRAGLYTDPESFMRDWRLDRRFTPAMSDEVRRTHRAGWRSAVEATLYHRGTAA